MRQSFFRPDAAEAAFTRKSTFQKPKSPYELGYRGKEHEVGESWRLRFLTGRSDQIQEIPARKAVVYDNTGGKMVKTIPDPGPELAREIVDHDGTPLSKCEPDVIYRMPVFVYYHRSKDGVITEINEMLYVEFGKQLYNSYWKMPEFDENGLTAFSEDTNRPEYDVMLRIDFNNPQIPKQYVFKPVTQDSSANRDANLQVPMEEVLSEYLESFEAGWKELQEVMGEYGRDEKSIRDAVKKWEKKGAAPQKGISRTPQMSNSQEATAKTETPAPKAEPTVAPTATTKAKATKASTKKAAETPAAPEGGKKKWNF